MTQLENKSGLMIGGGVFAAFAASICCLGPLVLTLLGISGAAVLSKFEILRGPMLVIVLSLFAVAGYSLYRKRLACEPGSLCADPKKWRKMAITYWLGLTTAVTAISSPYWITTNTGSFASRTLQQACYEVEGMTCAACTVTLKAAIGKLNGIHSVSASVEKKTATVEYDPDHTDAEAVKTAIDSTGYSAKSTQCNM